MASSKLGAIHRPPRYLGRITKRSHFRSFKTSPEIIRLAVMLYIRFPLSLRNVEDPLHKRGIEISHETVQYWLNRFGPMFAAKIRGRRVEAMRAQRLWRWHFDEVYVKINGMIHYLWRAVDHEGEVLESLGPQPLCNGAPPSEPQQLQADPRHRSRRVARTSCCLIRRWGMGNGDWFALV